MSNLSSVIKSIQDVMRQDSGVDGDAQRISQLTWLLFLKVFDALEEELELTRDDYKSPIPEAMRWRNWATDPEGITGDALLDFVNNQLFASLKSLSGDAQRNPRGYVVRGVFEDAYNYMKSGQLLRQVINKLNAIDFNRQAERHQFNDLYEKILKTNGRAALVLPDGTLFGEGVKTRIKEQLLAECNLHTIVRLPNGVFAPYTGIKTNLLFFTKGKPTEHVWYYEHPYPAGVKNYNKTKPIRIEEFDAEKAWWGSEVDGFAARVENERAWKVSIEQIKAANYNLDQKNPHAADVVSHDPDQLLADYARLQLEAQSLRDQLKAILSQSLGAQA